MGENRFEDTLVEDLYEMEIQGAKVLAGQMWLPVKDLIIDDVYQRSLNENRAREYAVNWNQALAGLITVSARKNKQYAILDGQHRARGAQIRGLEKVWCEVLYDLSPQLEAHVFRARNKKRVQTSSLDDFRAALAEGDEQAIRIRKILHLHEIKLGTNAKDPKTWASVAGLFILDDWGVLALTVKLIRSAWPDNPRAKEKDSLLAVGTFARSFRHQIDPDRWAARMATAPLNAWLSDAKSLHAMQGKRTFEHLTLMMTRHYDRRLDVGDIHWPTQGTVKGHKIASGNEGGGTARKGMK